MVTKGIVLGHRISAAGLEVDQANVSIIKTLLPPTTVKRIRSFLGHPSFYSRFIRDFSKISIPLCRLLEKDTKFNFDVGYQSSFEKIKSRLVEAPIMAKPDWNSEFEIMCDASDYAMGAVLGQKADKMFRAIYYARKTFNELKRTTQLLKNRCWPWYFYVKSLGHIYWGPMSSSILIMQQLNI